MIGSLHQLLPLIALALNVTLLAAAIASDRRDPRNRTFVAVAAALAVWNGAVFGLRTSADAVTARRWEAVVHVAIALVPALFYAYVLAFFGVSLRRRSLLAAFLLGVAFAALSPTSWLVAGVRPTTWGYVPMPGAAYPAFLIYFYGYVVAALAWLVASMRRLRSGSRASRARWIVAGALVSLGGGVVDFTRFLVDWDNLYPAGIPANAVFALALGVAVVRYRLMDITVIVRRALLYGLTSLALAPLVLVAVEVAARAHGALLPPLGGATALLAAVAAMALALPLLRKLEAILERVMFHREHGVRDALVELGKELPTLIDLHGVAQFLTRALVRGVPVRHASVYLPEDEGCLYRRFEWYADDDEDAAPPAGPLDVALVDWLTRERRVFVVDAEAPRGRPDGPLGSVCRALGAAHVAVAVPVIQDDGLAAFVLLGDKRSGDAFSRDELDLLEAVAGNAAIAFKNARLYGDLRRRMAELQATQQQLLQSAKLAAIGELAASVAHEVNNPLMVTLGHAGLLRHECPGKAPIHARLDVIEEQIQRAAKILRDLLDFARRREPTPEALDVHDVLARSLELVATKLAHAGTVADVELHGDLPSVIGDRDQLTQVFVNLFSNAIDAMPGGGILTLRADVQAADGARCLAIAVSDTGIGMSGEQTAHIFDPFYTTKPDGQGTGLGLTVSLGIVRKHEGTIEVASEPGKGSTFVVSLPIVDSSP